jgi:hypothetical protein
MALQTWLRDDIRNVLLGLEMSSAGAAETSDSPETYAWRLGFRSALAAAAVSFGISPQEVRLFQRDIPTGVERTSPLPIVAPGDSAIR